MDRGELQPRTLTGQPSTFHPHRPHRLRPGVEALSGIDEVHSGVNAVVHLAAIPGATFAPNVATFDNNLVSTFHVFQAAKLFKIHNLVWVSSETLLGYAFNSPPAYVPLDENAPPTPEVVYALAKDLEEAMARQYCRWNLDQKMIGLRFSTSSTPPSTPTSPPSRTDRPGRWRSDRLQPRRRLAEDVENGAADPRCAADRVRVAQGCAHAGGRRLPSRRARLPRRWCSTKPRDGYDKWTMAGDLHHLVRNELGIDGPLSVVGHDLGSMVAFAYALRYRDDVVSLTIMEAPLPGTDYYEQRKVAKSAWHFDFHANPDIAVYLTHGRERWYITRFFDDLTTSRTRSARTISTSMPAP